MNVGYNRQVNKSPVFIGFITFTDAFLLVPLVGGSLGTGSYELGVVGAAAYIFYGIIFRFNRPAGYGPHFFLGRFITPKSFRAGRISPPLPFKLEFDPNPSDPHKK